MADYKRKSVALTVLKIVFLIAYALVTAYLLYTFIDGYTKALAIAPGSTSMDPIGAFKLGFAFVWIIGLIAYGVVTVIAIVGLIVAIVKKFKGSIVFFVFGMVIPALSGLAFSLALTLI